MNRVVFLLLFIPSMLWSQANFEKAEQLLESGKTEQARVLFESILKENPSHLKAIEYLGDIAGQNKSWDKALFYYKKLKQLQPDEANYYYKYGGALGMKAKEVNKFKALGMIDEIKSSFEKAIILDPKHKESRWALVLLYVQLPGIIGGSEAKAVAYSNELMRLSPLEGYLSKGYIEEYFGRNKKAELNYIKAFELTNSKLAFQKLYNLYLYKMKNSDKAKQLKEQFEK
ncbi:tetratricopeptide repeat protein [Flavobacterium sp.]|jgi:tetratricopeptide (TPR) repeat protein|uniref:tetratricopeptide repeat protein n=1 Tax=Flavobacterium sp. TaxID=239 RepID=UPI00286F5961|nr:tetratricopeptide repeat protein [Flavobacterium sp.]